MYRKCVDVNKANGGHVHDTYFRVSILFLILIIFYGNKLGNRIGHKLLQCIYSIHNESKSYKTSVVDLLVIRGKRKSHELM